jgi:hypothetical protein
MRLLPLPLLPCLLLFSSEFGSVSLRDLQNKPVSFPLAGGITAIVFYSTQCPISNEYNDRMSALYRDYSAKGIHFLFVNANQNEPLREMASHSKSAEFPFPVYKDAGNTLADRLGATVTPETFVFDAGSLRYRGNIDDARNPARAQVFGLKDALDQLLGGNPVTRKETKSFGCIIKRVKKAS